MGTVRFFRHSTKLSRYYIPTEYVALAVIEFLALMLALYLALEIRFWGGDWHHGFGSFLPKALLYTFVMQTCLVAFGLYQRQTGRFINMLVLRIASGILLGMIPLGVGFYIAPEFFLGRGVLLLAVFISFIFISVIRLFFRKVIKESNIWTRILVLGAGHRAGYIREALSSGELRGLNVIAYVAMPGDEYEESDDIITLDDTLIHYIEDQDIDEIVIAVDDRRSSVFPTKELIDCKMSGVNILDMITFFERRAGKVRLDMLNPSWLYLSEGFHLGTFRRIGKRVMDIVVVSLLLPVALPFAILVALAIFIESGGKGSVLYSQIRVKQYGEPFKIYKFRSMVLNAEKDGVAQCPMWPPVSLAPP